MRTVSLLVIAILLTLSTHAKSEIIFRSFDDDSVVFINGKIDKGDMQKLVSLPINWERTMVLLNSEGGSTADALVMSAFLVTKRVITVVLPNHRCVSECALVWFSGYRKMLARSSTLGFGDTAYELSHDEKQLIAPMLLGDQFDPNISGLGFVAVGTLLQKGMGLDFRFISEFVGDNSQRPKYLNETDFEKYGIAVIYENDETEEFRDVLRESGILSD